MLLWVASLMLDGRRGEAKGMLSANSRTAQIAESQASLSERPGRVAGGLERGGDARGR